MTPYSIVLADDHAMLRQGVKRIIEEVENLQVVGEANDGLELLEIMKKKRPDLVILDISMPNLRGLEAAREIKTLYPQVKILLLTMHKKKDFLQEGIEAAVDGFLVKEDADTELLQAVEAIRRGKKFFSPLLSEKLADLRVISGKPIISPGEKRRSSSSWLKEKAAKKSPSFCISVSIQCAGTETISCASWI